jgi:DinB family protein
VRTYHRRIPDAEITEFRDQLLWLLRGTVGTLDGLTIEELNWRPPAKDANSLLALATHTLGAAEAHVLELLAGRQIDRVRASEFNVSGGAEPVRARLEAVTERITTVLDDLDAAELDRERPTPGGQSTGRGVLVWAVMHASQHHGVAQLTRDLVLGARTAR